MQTTASHTTLTPTLFDWDDQRTYDNWGDCTNGHVLDKQTQRLYGVLNYDNEGMRRVFYTLSATQILFMSFIRIPKRIRELFDGNFISIGSAQAEQEWLTENSKRSQAGAIVSVSSLYKKTIVKSLWNLIKEIAKIVTFPLAIIALEFSALYGVLINQLDARKLWSMIEHLWNVSYPLDTISPLIGVNISGYHCGFDILSDVLTYIAPCMQPKDVWVERNLYRILGSYSPDSGKSRLLQIRQKLETQRDFLAAEGLDVTRTIAQVHLLSDLGNHKSEFKDILADIDSIRNDRLAIIAAQNALSNSPPEITREHRATIATVEKHRQVALKRLNHLCTYWKEHYTQLHKKLGCKLHDHRLTYTLRGIIRTIRRELKTEKEFFTGQGLDVQHTLDCLHVFTHHKMSFYPEYNCKLTYFKKEVSLSDAHEVDLDGKLTNRSMHVWHREALQRMMQDMQTVREMVDLINKVNAKTGNRQATKYDKAFCNLVEKQRHWAVMRLGNPCLYWRVALPLEMHQAMKCKNEKICYSNTTITYD